MARAAQVAAALEMPEEVWHLWVPTGFVRGFNFEIWGKTDDLAFDHGFQHVLVKHGRKADVWDHVGR